MKLFMWLLMTDIFFFLKGYQGTTYSFMPSPPTLTKKKRKKRREKQGFGFGWNFPSILVPKNQY